MTKYTDALVGSLRKPSGGRCVRPLLNCGLFREELLPVLPLLAILGITVWWAVSAWNAVDVEMSIHGYIASQQPPLPEDAIGSMCRGGATQMRSVPLSRPAKLLA